MFTMISVVRNFGYLTEQLLQYSANAPSHFQTPPKPVEIFQE